LTEKSTQKKPEKSLTGFEGSRTMARIADEDIKKLKAEVSLLRLIESQGYSPKKQGKDHAIRCPFHADDNTPSLIISPQSNLFHYFGCGAAGSVIDWVMKTQGVSFRHAVTVLKEDAGLVSESKANIKRSTTKTLPPLAAEANNQKIIHHVVDYYHQTLKQSPEALAYLESRGLKSSELIDTFKLGYANRTLAYRLPEKQVKAGKEIRSQLQEIGLLRKSGHEHFNGSLVVPVINEQNHISEIYGRKLLGNKLRKGTPQHLYLPGAHQGIWNEKALMACRNGEIILCEALIDAMTFWVNGFRNVTASYGTAGFTEDHLLAFKQYTIKRILIAYDRDEAGNTAADKLAHLLNENGIDAFRILLPKGMDVNEFAQQVTPAQKSLGLAIRKAQWLGKKRPGSVLTFQ
jgi:DNA primase catalytic core